MLSIVMDYMSENDEVAVVRQSTGAGRIELNTVIEGQELLKFQTAVRDVALPAALGQYIVDLVASSRPTEHHGPDFIRHYVAWGAGLRASQNIALAAKSFAAQDGRATACLADVRRAIVPVMRHRIGLAFRAAVDRVSVEDVIQRLVKATPEPKMNH
jgi:MoxR-like ATPase